MSTTPFDIIGKSGATAAMLEHGLPILAHDDGDTSEGKLFVLERFQDQIFLLNNDSIINQLNAAMQKPRKPFFDGVAYTAKKNDRIYQLNPIKQENPYQNPWPWRTQLILILWRLSWLILCSWTPKYLNAWRILVLKVFGAKLKENLLYIAPQEYKSPGI